MRSIARRRRHRCHRRRRRCRCCCCVSRSRPPLASHTHTDIHRQAAHTVRYAIGAHEAHEEADTHATETHPRSHTYTVSAHPCPTFGLLAVSERDCSSLDGTLRRIAPAGLRFLQPNSDSCSLHVLRPERHRSPARRSGHVTRFTHTHSLKNSRDRNVQVYKV